MANTIQDTNRGLANRINAEARSNPQSPYANKFVGIANGQVVVVADDLDELVRRLRQAEPDPKKCFGMEASRDYSEVHEIWSNPDPEIDDVEVAAIQEALSDMANGDHGQPADEVLEEIRAELGLSK